MAALARTGASEILRWDRGLMHTVVALTRRPGPAIREYLGGRTRPYSNPIKYLLILVALAALVFGLLGLHPAGWSPPEAQPDPGVARFLEIYTRYFNVFLVLAIPFLALYSRLIFRKSGLNLTEHLVFNTYVYAHQNLLSLAVVGVWLVPGDSTGAILGASLILLTAYYVFACRQFFQVGVVEAIVRAALVALLANLTYLLALTLVLRGYVLLQGR